MRAREAAASRIGRRARWAAIAFAGVLFCSSLAPAAADYEAGQRALEAGDTNIALVEWEAAAARRTETAPPGR